MSKKPYQQVAMADLSPPDQDLVEAARSATDLAYAPYSRFLVGAGVRAYASFDEPQALSDPRIFKGANVENAAYGNTICAERSAMICALMARYPNIDAIAITVRGADGMETEAVTGPCGACEQNMIEMTSLRQKDIRVILATTRRDVIVVTSVQKLRQMPFSASDLGLNLAEWRHRLTRPLES